MYIVLHGECRAVIENKEFLEYRRSLREKIKKLYTLVEKSISVEDRFEKAKDTDFDYLDNLQDMLDTQKKLLVLRKSL